MKGYCWRFRFGNSGRLHPLMRSVARESNKKRVDVCKGRSRFIKHPLCGGPYCKQCMAGCSFYE